MLARAAARLLVAILLYLCLGTVMYFIGFLLLRSGIPTDFPWLHAVQKNLYHGGIRNIWQNQPGCVAFDEQLIYRPKDGSCAFSNAEFRTVLNFSGRVRVHKPVAAGRAGIAVVGDSHAMGWGVNDPETFSALMQERLGRPVFNLAVSSYGTARELIALENSGLLDKVDTVVIQYSDNDVDENTHFKPVAATESRGKFAQVIDHGPSSLSAQLPFLYAGWRYAIKVPFAAIKSLWRDKPAADFALHYHPLMAVIRRHESLKDKRVIVFYSNGGGAQFRNFPSGPDPKLVHVRFVDLGTGPENYFALDDHLTAQGHRYVAEKLAEVIGAP
jgi:hypothetical protein